MLRTSPSVYEHYMLVSFSNVRLNEFNKSVRMGSLEDMIAQGTSKELDCLVFAYERGSGSKNEHRASSCTLIKRQKLLK